MVRLSLTAVAVCLFLPAVELQDFTIQIENSSINVTVGSSAFFSVRPSAETKSGNWVFKDKTLAQWVGTGVSIDNEYTTRAELFLPNGSLQLNSVTVLDRGEYTVTMFPKTGPQATATITLNVLESISKPIVSSNNTYPVEHNDTVTLTCSAQGQADSYKWLKGNKTLNPGGRIGLSADNKTLTISGVLRSDGGFVCHAYNSIDGSRSKPYYLNISYGPESLNISINPQLTLYILGSKVNFFCSAVSNPPSEFQWYLNSTSLEQNGQQLIIADISLNNTGNYTCEAFNNATKRYSLTTRNMVVVEPVSQPTILSNNTNPVEHNDTVALTCHASGTAVSYQWLKDNKTIDPGDRIGLSSDNTTLTISGVLRSDEEFTCHAYNMINGNTSDPLLLNVSYGPESLNISINPQLTFYVSGSNVNFSCSAISNPPSEFQWYLSSTSLEQNGQQLIITDISLNNTGNYTCEAFNNATKRYSLTTRDMVVVEPVSKPTILSNNTNPVEYNDTVALTCRASGTAVSYQWLKDNKTIDPGDRIGLSRDNTTLTISGVLRSDEEFTCRAYNMINGNTSDPLRLNVSYGPESLNISINPQLALYVLGSNVNFSCSAVSNPPSEFQWYLNSTSLEQNGQQLIIADITLNNTGNYTCEAFNNATKRYSLTTRDMVVIEPVSKPNVTANATNPIEHNDTVALTCFASGTAVSYQWLEDNSTIIPDKRFGLSGDNRTLTVSGVLRSDGGFMCYAYNAVNGMTSDLYHLDVSYGPDLPNISINPDLPVYISGRAVAFSCSADSNPPSEFEWYLNDTLLQPKGHQLTIDSITLNGTGKYTCHAFNNLTKKYNASTKQILVIEPVSSVNVSANNSKPVENIDTVSLSCSASGSVQTRIWFKNNRAIQDNDRIITTSPDNRTLTIISVNRNDSGTYKCNASNDFSFNSGDTILQINYGPENVSITPPGPVSVKLGHTLALHCSALSVPAGAYEWYNGTSVLKTGQTYTTDSISSYHDGNYTCQVNNIITKKGSTATIQVTVQEISDNNNGNKSNLSGGGIAGIVIAVAVLITAIVIGVWMIMKKVNRAKGGSQQNDIKMASPGNTPSPQTEYATVERKQPNIQTPVPSSNGTSSDATKPRDPDVVYAQPSILQQGAKSPNATTVDNKTDYAELKFR